MDAQVEEHWRHAVVDVTAPPSEYYPPSAPPSAEALRSGEWTSKLAEWLIQAQPISVAVNDNVEQNGFALALSLFEQTAVVVFTAGSLEVPALTCQARPQHGEVFGEVPPRRQLSIKGINNKKKKKKKKEKKKKKNYIITILLGSTLQHTLFPVLVPSPTPAYNSGYAHSYLASKGKEKKEWVQKPPVAAPKAALALVTLAAEDEAGGFGGGVGAGYVAELLEYLQGTI
ncbi:hypothetical protein T492DRAFT_839719 [Pavlovales sp. CCMP2436]|nr:hypothetical protein T492DRAFT_839719 [Pavlovales sp. CCMP2436]